MQKQLTPDAASSPKATSIEQLADVSHPQAGSLQESRATTLQILGNDFPVRITSAPTDYIGPSIQIAVAILSAAASAGLIIWQMRRQKAQADKQHKLSVKAELRLDAYRDFQVVNRNFSDSHIIETEIASIRSAISGAIEQLKDFNFQIPLSQREPIYRAAHYKHTTNAIALIYFLERYETLLPGFEVYRLALGSALHDIGGSELHLFSILLRWLPIDNPNFNVVAGAPQFLQLPKITDETLTEFNIAAVPLEKAFSQLSCWASDLSVDLQNYLLGEYADQQVKKREPIDGTYFTISIDPDKSVMLTKYFNEGTDWGRHWSRIHQEVRGEYETRKGSRGDGL